MALGEMLAELHQRRMADPRSRAAYEDTMRRLAEADAAAGALQVGDDAPAFLLPNAEGRLVALEALIEQGPAILIFFRGGWCPYCDLTMRTMQRALPAIAAAGGHVAAIWPDTGGAAMRAKRERGISYELLVDVDHAVALQFGITFRVPTLYRDGLAANGIDLAQRQGNAGWMLPMPATFLVTPERRIGYTFVSGDFARRAAPETIVRALTSGRP